jgi:hypothetical protein
MQVPKCKPNTWGVTLIDINEMGLYTPKHLQPLISRRGSEALPTLCRIYIHYFPPTASGSPIPLVQPRMGPLSHRSFFSGHFATLQKCEKGGNIRMCYVRLEKYVIRFTYLFSTLTRGSSFFFFESHTSIRFLLRLITMKTKWLLQSQNCYTMVFCHLILLSLAFPTVYH